MKVTSDDRTRLRAAIAPLDTDARRRDYRTGNFPRAQLVRDVNKRYRWDLFWRAGGASLLTGSFNDSHIDTALRSIVAPL